MSALEGLRVLELTQVMAGPFCGQVLGIPMKLSETPGQVRPPPPLLGEQTEELLREAGLSAEEIAAL